LKVAGYGSYLALNGDEALAYIEAKKPDLVILDIMMPKRSGLLVLEMIRQKILVPLPVIVITGNLGSRHREYAEMLGVQGYLHKPITLDRLVDAVDEILRPQEARSGRD
jgi:DNA-binding response OmpR family regulator